jgi:hypothetical protein
MELSPNFVFKKTTDHAHPETDVLGPVRSFLAQGAKKGVWTGTGFNQIWRPFHAKPPVPASQDRFLELNVTTENLEFDEISGKIPNRGFLQPDINLGGVHYLQQVSDTVQGGIHVEPGIWVNVPKTANPEEPGTVTRMASIPHGTTVVAQGTPVGPTAGPPTIPASDITPFVIGQPNNKITFPESNLAKPSEFRSVNPAVTQAMVNNPSSVLTAALAGQTIAHTTTFHVSTKAPVKPAPDVGGGTDNIAFLTGGTAGPNAAAAQMDATFWIETGKDAAGKPLIQLQYLQIVLLNFNKLSWPHVSVATLRLS